MKRCHSDELIGDKGQRRGVYTVIAAPFRLGLGEEHRERKVWSGLEMGFHVKQRLSYRRLPRDYKIPRHRNP